MRIAFVSPLPPAKSGIADYSAAVIESLRPAAAVETFTDAPGHFDPARFDAIIYQLGNNPFHTYAYEMALRYPGIVVLHEANLHHLVADLTIRRGAWDEYMRMVEEDRGAEAHAYAAKYVRTLQRGPDYEGVPMLKRILRAAKGVVVHSRYVADIARAEGFDGPLAVVPHGSWLDAAAPDRMAFRARLGVDETQPLIGIFGFLKPYKRVAESLRAFARLVKLEPRARMILCGEAHPELPLENLLGALRLTAHVRHLGYTPIEDFAGYLSACDIVMNLRYPTAGENSGTLQRALGMGKAAIVSDVGAFREYPDGVCLKAPVGHGEENHLFEYLNLLVSRPGVARAMGERARAWVERECRWELSAECYRTFAEAVARGEQWRSPLAAGDRAAEPAPSHASPVRVDASDVLSWTPEPEARAYAEQHITRLERTLALTPPGGPGDAVLEMGAYMQITPALKTRLGYGRVRGCYFGPAGRVDRKIVRSGDGQEFACEIDLFDAEKDPFPYADGEFATVLCCELIEHLPADPMHLMSEVNRILRPGGRLVLTTPNIASLRALAGILQGFHPMLFPAYIRPRGQGEPEARHNREYTPREIEMLFAAAGLEVDKLETGAFREEPRPDLAWVEHLLKRYWLPAEHRGDGIFAVGRKTAAVKERYPAWLYS